MIEHIKEKVNQISGLLGVTETIYGWCYDTNGTILYSNCPDEILLDGTFSLCVCKSRMLEHYETNRLPYIAGLPFGIVWISTIEYTEEGNHHIYAFGPVFTSEVTYSQIQEGILHCVTKDPGIISVNEAISLVKTLPTLTSSLIQRYALMLHFLINNEHIEFSEITVNNKLNPENASNWLKSKDRHKTWIVEQELLQAVREGNLNYKQVLLNAQTISKGTPVIGKDPLRSQKTSSVIFISLCTRAAIEGGLSPEEAYSLGDSYIQKVENYTNYSEFATANHDMYLDFIQRVHRKKQNPRYSLPIQKCCDYITFHIEEKIELKQLATQIGYSEYYLSKKFKRETGISINHFIRNAKIERAKHLLASTNLHIDDISNILHFSSNAYFGDVFQKTVGITPSIYRKQHQLFY